MRPLSEATRNNVKALLFQGKSTREVQKELNVSHGFVSKVHQENQENIPPVEMGRPQKISKSTQHTICSQFLTGKQETFNDAHEYIQSVNEGPVHKRTIKRCLARAGVKAGVKQDEPYLTPEQVAKRYQFAKDHINWTLEDWTKVMFSDECIVSRLGTFGKQYFYSNDEHWQQHPHHFRQKTQGSGGKIMIWGCITYHGVGDLGWIEGHMKAEDYVSVLDKYVLASRDWNKMDPANFIFQHDNASIHTAGMTQRFLTKKRIKVMVWPPNSPDLNPIERVWAYIKQHLDLYPTRAKTLQELFNRIEEIWLHLPPNYLHELYEDLPNKIKRLKETGGWTTRPKRNESRRS